MIICNYALVENKNILNFNDINDNKISLLYNLYKGFDWQTK